MTPSTRAQRRRDARATAYSGTRPVAGGPPRADVWWAVALIALAAIGTYANSLAHPFVFDDFGSIVRNPQIRDLTHLGQVLAPPADTSVANRPLVNLSFAINYAIGGLSVVGYHVVNLALHLGCALLLFAIARRTIELAGGERAGRATGLAAAIAVLWTVHPLGSEVVDYLSERSDSMMALAYLLAMYASLRARSSPRPASWLAASVASCAAGMACKESMVTAPVMIVIYDAVFVFGSIAAAWRSRWKFYAALAATWALLATSFAARGAISTGGFASAHATAWTYLLNQTQMVTRYIRLAFWPAPLVNYYGWTQPLAFVDVWPYAAVLAVLAAATAVLFVVRPKAGFLAAWVFVVLGPTSSIIPIAAEVGAERRMYLPLAGLIALVVIGADAILRRVGAAKIPAPGSQAHARPSGAVLVGVVALALATVTIVRNTEYASALTLARTILTRWPTPAAHHLVGTELAFAGRHEDAIAELRIAAPDYAPSRFYLGNELAAAGKLDEAIATLESFIRDEPTAPVVPSARMTIARAYWAKGDYAHVVEACEQVLAAQPSNNDAQALEAESLMRLNRASDAVAHYEAFANANPANPNGWSSLGLALVSLGKTAEAAQAFGHAVEASPSDGHLRENFARALLDLGRVADAEAQAKQAVALMPAEPGGHDVLARVFKAEGALDAARAEFTRALQLNPDYAPARDGLRSIGGR